MKTNETSQHFHNINFNKLLEKNCTINNLGSYGHVILHFALCICMTGASREHTTLRKVVHHSFCDPVFVLLG